MEHTLVIRLAILPLGVLASCYLVSAGYLINFWHGHWENKARIFFLGFIWAGLMWLAIFGTLAASTAAQAFAWERCVPLLTIFSQLSGWESYLVMGNRPIPRWHLILWVIGGLSGIIALIVPHSIDQGLGRVPDGYWLHFLHPTPFGFWLAALFLFCFLGSKETLMVLALRQHVLRFRIYALLAVLDLPLFWNDLVRVRTGPTPFPLIWIVGLIVLAELWIEIHRQAGWMERQLAFDELTHAYTRLYGGLYARHQLESNPMGVLYGDLDHFKRINDSYGHNIGDRILTMVVARMQKICRASDRVIRMGGDEFAIVFPNLTAEQGIFLMARLQSVLAADPLRVPEMDADDAVQISLGWAWGRQGSNFNDLIAAADQKMYAEKTTKPGAPPIAVSPREVLQTPETIVGNRGEIPIRTL